MRKLILILLAFLAIFTYLRAFEGAQASETLAEKPVEITR
jgi:hypothetical protein